MLKKETAPSLQTNTPQDFFLSSGEELFHSCAKSQAVRYALIGSCLFHAAFFLFAFLETSLFPPTKTVHKIPTKLAVATVSLQKKEPFKTVSQQIDQEKVIQENPPISHNLVAQNEIPHASPIVETVPSVEQVEEKTPEATAPKENTTTPKQPKKNIKKVENKKKLPPKKAASQPIEKSSTPTPTSTKSKKKEGDVKKTNGNKNTSTAVKPKTESINQSLLQEALRHLDSNNSPSTKGTQGGKGSSSPKNRTSARMVGSLQSEQEDFHVVCQGDDIPPSTPEAWYISDLIRRLQLHVRLKEPGIVRLSLTLTKDGKCIKLTIQECASSQTRKELEKMLPSLRYAPFGQAFSHEKEHSFRLKLEDDGTWSL